MLHRPLGNSFTQLIWALAWKDFGEHPKTTMVHSLWTVQMIFSSQVMGSSLTSFEMIFEALPSEQIQTRFSFTEFKNPQIPKFNLTMDEPLPGCQSILQTIPSVYYTSWKYITMMYVLRVYMIRNDIVVWFWIACWLTTPSSACLSGLKKLSKASDTNIPLQRTHQK